MVTITKNIDVDSQQVLHSIGYDNGRKPSARVLSLIKEYADDVCRLIKPSYSYVVRDIESAEDSRVAIEGSVIFQSEVVSRLLSNCEKVAVFVLTIGDQLEDMVFQLVEDKLVLQAAILDAIGSGVVETVADFVRDRIGDMDCAKGLCKSRLSPNEYAKMKSREDEKASETRLKNYFFYDCWGNIAEATQSTLKTIDYLWFSPQRMDFGDVLATSSANATDTIGGRQLSYEAIGPQLDLLGIGTAQLNKQRLAAGKVRDTYADSRKLSERSIG